MHESLRLLETAAGLALREEEALAAGDEELLERLCLEREDLMAKAWERRNGCDAVELEEKLRSLRTLQRRLTHKAETQAAILREALKDSRRQGVGLSGYHRASGRPDGPVYLKRTS